MNYCIVTDNDSHHYVIPSSRIDQWFNWCDNNDDFVPQWADPIGGDPSLVVFENYKIEY